MKPGSVVMLPNYGMLEGEGQVSVWGWVPSSVSFSVSYQNFLCLASRGAILHTSPGQAAPAGLSLPLPRCLIEEERQGGTLMVNVVLTGGAAGQNRPPSIL